LDLTDLFEIIEEEKPEASVKIMEKVFHPKIVEK
jgi:hypothetical protein